MNDNILQLMSVQGEIKVRLIKAGMHQTVAHEIAADLLDYIATSPVVTEAHRQDYLALSS